jgi:hypothetical protein
MGIIHVLPLCTSTAALMAWGLARFLHWRSGLRQRIDLGRLIHGEGDTCGC